MYNSVSLPIAPEFLNACSCMGCAVSALAETGLFQGRLVWRESLVLAGSPPAALEAVGQIRRT